MRVLSQNVFLTGRGRDARAMNFPRVFFFFGIAVVSSVLASEAGKATHATDERVPFPASYQTAFQEIRASNKTGQSLVGTIYANAPAASIKELDKLPYPEGSVLVMEWAQPVKDSNGEFLKDAAGLWKKGKVVRVDVMRREKGFGAAYGDKRAGEWEFASYGPDGSAFLPAPTLTSCAECHAKAAKRDFIFRGRFPAIEEK
jgi:hypothetical protein